MRPNFPLKNMALHTLIKFQEAEFIFRYTDFIRTRDTNEENLLNMDVEIIELELGGMSEELNQTIQTTTDLTKTILFEELKENIRDFDLLEINKEKIKRRIDKWNEEKYKLFLQEVDKETEEYFKRSERKLYKHLEKYQVKNKILPLLGWGTPLSDLIVYTNYNIYSIETIPDLIDEKYLEDYYKFLDYILTKYRSIVSPLMKLYDEGKLTASSSKSETFYDRSVKWFKNNKVTASVILVIVSITAVLAFVNQVKDTTDRFLKQTDDKSTSDTLKVERKYEQPKDSISKTIADSTKSKIDTTISH